MIAEASGGIPRTINILCDTALVYGFACGVPVITEEIVASVIDNKNRFGVLPISMPAT
jgi:type II secretory pathway predicted ATPase ExeA